MQLLDLKMTPEVQQQAKDAIRSISDKIDELALDKESEFSRKSADDKIVVFKNLRKILAEKEEAGYLEIRKSFNDWKNAEYDLPKNHGKKSVAEILALQRREGFFASFNPRKTDSETLCETIAMSLGA